MNWKLPINFMWGAQEQQAQSNVEDIPTQSWFQSVFSSSSRPSTHSSSSGISAHKRASDHPQSPLQGQPSLAEATEVIAHLKDKSIDELSFLHSLDQVKNQNNVCDERRRETLQLARENLEKEPPILEFRNQCTIIRTTELASAREKFTELERQKEEMMRSYSPASLLQKSNDALNKVEEESEALHRQLLDREIDLPTFVQKYKKIRTTYHRRALLHLAAKISVC